jgi:hypothetical protein
MLIKPSGGMRLKIAVISRIDPIQLLPCGCTNKTFKVTFLSTFVSATEATRIIYLFGNTGKSFLFTGSGNESNPEKWLFLFWYQEKSDIFPLENSSKGMHIVLPQPACLIKIYSHMNCRYL